MGLLQHVAPRVIQLQGVCSRPVSITRSILAGCKFSVAFTRVYLKEEYNNINQAIINQARIEAYVDDSPITAQGRRQRVLETLFKAGK